MAAGLPPRAPPHSYEVLASSSQNERSCGSPAAPPEPVSASLAAKNQFATFLEVDSFIKSAILLPERPAPSVTMTLVLWSCFKMILRVSLM